MESGPGPDAQGLPLAFWAGAREFFNILRNFQEFRAPKSGGPACPAVRGNRDSGPGSRVRAPAENKGIPWGPVRSEGVPWAPMGSPKGPTGTALDQAAHATRLYLAGETKGGIYLRFTGVP